MATHSFLNLYLRQISNKTFLSCLRIVFLICLTYSYKAADISAQEQEFERSVRIPIESTAKEAEKSALSLLRINVITEIVGVELVTGEKIANEKVTLEDGTTTTRKVYEQNISSFSASIIRYRNFQTRPANGWLEAQAIFIIDPQVAAQKLKEYSEAQKQNMARLLEAERQTTSANKILGQIESDLEEERNRRSALEQATARLDSSAADYAANKKALDEQMALADADIQRLANEIERRKRELSELQEIKELLASLEFRRLNTKLKSRSLRRYAKNFTRVRTAGR